MSDESGEDNTVMVPYVLNESYQRVYHFGPITGQYDAFMTDH